MKKLARIILPALLVALCVVTALFATAETQLPEQCPHCKQAVTWTALPTDLATDATLGANHYYVDAATTTLSNVTVAKSTNVCIYMNGNNIEASGVNRVFTVRGTLNIMGQGTVKGYGRDQSLTDTSSRYGGTIYIASGGTFNLYDATIANEKITGSKASNGGNINVSGTFNMYSGALEGGYASNAGGSMFISPSALFNMYGGSVTGGACGTSSGTSICSQGRIRLSGNATLENLYMWDKNSITWEKMLTVEGIYYGSAKITLRSTTPTADLVVGTSENANVRRATFNFANSGLFVKVDGTQLKLTTEDPNIVNMLCKHCNETVTWTPLTEETAESASLSAGHYYLDFLTGADEWTPKSVSSQVCLDLNGMTLTSQSRVFTVLDGGTLSIQGNGTVAGRGYASSKSTSDRVGGTFRVSSDGTLNIYGGTLTFEKIDGQNASNGGVICAYGDVNMYGGTVTGGYASNAGGNIFITPTGSFRMEGGEVSAPAKGKSIYCQGPITLAGNATVDEIYFKQKENGTEAAAMLTIEGAYIGAATLEYYDLTFAEGTVFGISDNADLSHASISITDCQLLPTAEGTALKVVSSLPVITKEAYCSVCKKDVTWTCLMESFAGQTNIESGHYYLEFGNNAGIWDRKIISGKVCLDLNGQTLTGNTRALVVESGSVLNLLGQGTVVGRGMSSSLEIQDKTAGTILVESQATLNQYGGTLTYESVTAQNAGNGGILNVAGTYNLYDGAVVNGKSIWVGGNIFVTTSGAFNMYGGTVSGGSASQAGNSIACRGSVMLTGDASINELYLYPNTADGGPALSEMLTICDAYTGSVKLRVSGIAAGMDVGSSHNADLSGATITTNSSSLSLAIRGTDLVLVGKSATVALMNGSSLVSSHSSIAEAMAAVTDTAQYIVLFDDANEELVLTKDIYVDLNGHHITGSITGEGTMYCMDAFTNDFSVADGICGTVSSSEYVQPVPVAAPCSDFGYLMVTKDGKASFHAIKLQINGMSLRPSNAGLYFTCAFAGDALVKEQVTAFGVAVSLAGDPESVDPNKVLRTVVEPDVFGAGVDATSCMIANIMKTTKTDQKNAEHAAMQIYGRTYIQLGDTVVYGDCFNRSLQDQLCGTEAMYGIERMWDALTINQRRGVMDMYATFENVMSTWDIPTIAAATANRDDAGDDILLARRAKVMEKMRLMGDLYWRATEDVKYRISSTGRWVEFKAGRIYRGIPYAYARSDQNTFLEFASEPDEKGIYNISGLTTTHMGNGSAYARIGNDCSGSVNFSWSSVGADISGTNSSRYMIEANGYYKVGDYEYTPTEDGRVGISKEIVAANGKEKMFEAYAKVQGGDGLDTTAAGGGHVILVMGKHVVYNADGSINGERSYIHTLEQTPGPVSITVQQHSWNDDLDEMVYDIYIEKNLSFNQAYSSGYLPITVKVLTDPAPVPEAAVEDSLTAQEYSYENLLKGTLNCTRMISSVNLTVTDENGQVFSITGSGIRASIRTYYMKNFLTEDPAVMRGTLELDKLIPGQDYHCTVTVQLASGDIITVRDFDFTATDADISTPENTDTPTEPSEPEDDGDGVPEETTGN